MRNTTRTIPYFPFFICLLSLTLPTQGQEKLPPESFTNLHATITYKGSVPKNPIPDFAGFRRNQFHVDKSNLGLEGAVIYLIPFDTSLIPPFAPNDSDDEPIVIDQFDETFEAQVTAVRQGQPVQLTNHDDLNHNVRSSPQIQTNEFNIVTRSQSDYEKIFVPEPDYQPIPLSCDIHAWMGAWLYVFDHPWFAVTDKNGKAAIQQIPTGMYTMVITHPAANFSAQSIVRIRPNKKYSITHFFNQVDINTPEPGTINLIGFGPKP